MLDIFDLELHLNYQIHRNDNFWLRLQLLKIRNLLSSNLILTFIEETL